MKNTTIKKINRIKKIIYFNYHERKRFKKFSFNLII